MQQPLTLCDHGDWQYKQHQHHRLFVLVRYDTSIIPCKSLCVKTTQSILVSNTCTIPWWQGHRQLPFQITDFGIWHWNFFWILHRNSLKSLYPNLCFLIKLSWCIFQASKYKATINCLILLSALSIFCTILGTAESQRLKSN